MGRNRQEEMVARANFFGDGTWRVRAGNEIGQLAARRRNPGRETGIRNAEDD
jgi:hypothetical protein